METFTATAKQRNLDKQAGFCVDRDGESITSPLAITAGDIANAIRRIAKVVQMHLVEDHTRQQDAPDASLDPWRGATTPRSPTPGVRDVGGSRSAEPA
ncbi:hypothetical protein [Micromonospora sp. Mcm103]|uniref:hypothetical protein n=1 Tax=Micromonospora sp. Mcm103 TaxID=2926015 RepID=UPI0021C6CCAE|nr:hypothetical protein [Micromonospora sp. Mcm103]